MTRTSKQLGVRILALAVVLAVPATSFADETLAWKFKAGETIAYRKTQDSTASSKGAGRNDKQTTVRTTDVKLAVDSVDADGAGQLTFTISRIQIAENTSKGRVDYDSQSKAKPDPKAKQHEVAAKPLLQAAWNLRMSADGKISQIKPTPETLKRMNNAPVADQKAVNNDGIRFMIPGVVFPTGQLAVGRIWKETGEFADATIGTRKLVTTFQYLASKEKSGHSIAEISTSMTYSLLQPKNAKVLIDVKEQSKMGTIFFDCTVGRVVSWNELETSRTEMKLQGQVVQTEGKSVTTFELRSK